MAPVRQFSSHPLEGAYAIETAESCAFSRTRMLRSIHMHIYTIFERKERQWSGLGLEESLLLSVRTPCLTTSPLQLRRSSGDTGTCLVPSTVHPLRRTEYSVRNRRKLVELKFLLDLSSAGLCTALLACRIPQILFWILQG